ncbi:6-bladed beta-propeller [Parabacteroides faecis]|uniref:6-bladed beta-propeller n=1 Tax=Parabacteroides faecis TaxID=1217282 RepID=A0ABR6KHQ3_9BACT|nr:6-bladed beta-propeller [Parabacteroides faecis]MBB4620324.1 hypothetical protein [Parabacteroides faecis]
MTKTTTYIVIGVICLLFFSCNKKDNTYQGKVLSVELKENELDPSHLFSKVEIIPLETTDESLITSIHQIIEYNNRFYILDDRISVLFCFDKSGKFLYKIDKTGDGPEEYNLISETIINQNKIYMLSPMGFIHVYDIEGNFVDKYQLPSGGGHDMIKLENDIIAYWTLLGNPLEYKVTFYNLINKQVVGGFWKDNDDTFMSNMCIEVFYNYDNNYYFSTQFSNEVYRFNTDTIELEYKWDFGHNNLNLKPYIKDVKKDLNNFSKLTDTMEIPYYFFRNFQNKNYYYTILKSWPIDKWRNIFYRKKDGKSYVFDTLKGGVKVKDVSILTDTYMISVISPEEIQSCKEIISNEDLKKYNKLKDDSNLCLFKLYFK